MRGDVSGGRRRPSAGLDPLVLDVEEDVDQDLESTIVLPDDPTTRLREQRSSDSIDPQLEVVATWPGASDASCPHHLLHGFEVLAGPLHGIDVPGSAAVAAGHLGHDRGAVYLKSGPRRHREQARRRRGARPSAGRPGDEAGLRALADTENEHAADRLAHLLYDRGDEAGLRALTDTENEHASAELARLLYDRADEAGLRAADTGNEYAAGRLAHLLYDRGDEAGLRALTDTENEHAAYRLAHLLYDRGDEAGLRALVLLGYLRPYRRSISLLTDLIAQQDRAKAEAVYRYGPTLTAGPQKGKRTPPSQQHDNRQDHRYRSLSCGGQGKSNAVINPVGRTVKPC